MEYFKVSIDGSLAEYQVIDCNTELFTDLLGNLVDTPQEPIRYIYRSWEIPAWAI